MQTDVEKPAACGRRVDALVGRGVHFDAAVNLVDAVERGFERAGDLTDEERAVLDAVDMAPILGSAEDRLKHMTGIAVRLLRQREQLTKSLKETRDACAAALRVIVRGRLMPELENELAIAGVGDGFGRRADDAVNCVSGDDDQAQGPIASGDEISRIIGQHVRCLDVLRQIRNEHPSYWMIDKLIDDVMIENGLTT